MTSFVMVNGTPLYYIIATQVEILKGQHINFIDCHKPLIHKTLMSTQSVDACHSSNMFSSYLQLE